VVWERVRRADGERHHTLRDVAVDCGSGRVMEVGSGGGRAGRGWRSAQVLAVDLGEDAACRGWSSRESGSDIEVRGIVSGLLIGVALL
jgi:hypothetical protein